VFVGSRSHDPSLYAFAARRSGRPWLSYPVLLITAVGAVVLTFFALFRIDLGSGPLISFRHEPMWRSTAAQIAARVSRSARAFIA
jgi:hypothetical protein